MRKYLILTSGTLLSKNGKTAQGVIRYAPDAVTAVVDADLAGRNVRDVLPQLGRDVPIVASVEEGLRYHPTSLLLGSAPMGGQVPPEWRSEILTAIRSGLEVVSGLHEFLSEDPEFTAEAAKHGTAIFDVRKVPEVPLFSGRVYDVTAPTLLTVGNDCAVGKMTVSLEIVAAARASGVNACFVPTGQTGIMIAGWGIAVDRVISDFAAGAAEQLVLDASKTQPDLIVVEGQGAINHPAYACVTAALLFGSAPDALLLVCDPSYATIEPYGTPVLSYRELISIYEATCATVKPAEVVGIAINTSSMPEKEAHAEIERARRDSGLPADDIIRFGAQKLYEAIAPQLHKRHPLSRVSVGSSSR